MIIIMIQTGQLSPVLGKSGIHSDSSLEGQSTGCYTTNSSRIVHAVEFRRFVSTSIAAIQHMKSTKFGFSRPSPEALQYIVEAREGVCEL